MASLEMFFDKSFASIFLSRVEWVDLDNLGNEGIFEVNGMIEGLMGRELLVSFLGKYIGKVNTEVRDGYFLGFLGLSDFCGDGEFVQMFVHRSV